MKTVKLVIGICSIVLSPILYFLICLSRFNIHSSVLIFVPLLFLTAGIICLCTHKSDSSIPNIFSSVLYFLCFLLLILCMTRPKIGAVYIHITLFIISSFAFSIASILFIIYSRYFSNKSEMIISKDSSKRCPICNIIYYNDVCPSCGTNADKVNFKKCVFCNTVTHKDICPKCNSIVLVSDVNSLKANGFVISKTINGIYSTIYIDDVNKKWCIYNKIQHCSEGVFSYNKIIRVELFKDGQNFQGNNFDKALIGGLLFGTSGAVIGASSAKANYSLCKNMSVLIYINNLYKPMITIDIIKTPIDVNSLIFKNNLSFAREILSTFEYMINNVGQEKALE